MSCFWSHTYGRAFRDVRGVDYQSCTRCGHERKSPIQFGHVDTRTGQRSALLTVELEREVEAERVAIRRREQFWK